MTPLNEAALEAAKEKVLDGRGERIWLEDVCMQFLKTYLAALPIMGDASTRKDEVSMDEVNDGLRSAKQSESPTTPDYKSSLVKALEVIKRPIDSSPEVYLINSVVDECKNVIRQHESAQQPDEEWKDCPDEWTDEIAKAQPTITGNHESYEFALQLVSNRHGKGELVDLVNWLLWRIDRLQYLSGITQGVEAIGNELVDLSNVSAALPRVDDAMVERVAKSIWISDHADVDTWEEGNGYEKKEILANLKRLKHKNPNHQRGIGYNEGLDNAIVVVQGQYGAEQFAKKAKEKGE